jgi:hypothetical protein
MGFYPGPRAETEPFFMARDRRRPYTYSAASTDLKRMLRMVSPDDFAYGLHGLRVQGYNDARDGDGEDMAVAHGGWQSSAHTRYARFPLSRVLALSSAMVGTVDNGDEGGSHEPPDVMSERGQADGPAPREWLSAEDVQSGDEEGFDDDNGRLASVSPVAVGPSEDTIAERIAARRAPHRP